MSDPAIFNALEAEIEKLGSPMRGLLVDLKFDPTFRRIAEKSLAAASHELTIDPGEIEIPPARQKP